MTTEEDAGVFNEINMERSCTWDPGNVSEVVPDLPSEVSVDRTLVA